MMCKKKWGASSIPARSDDYVTKRHLRAPPELLCAPSAQRHSEKKKPPEEEVSVFFKNGGSGCRSAARVVTAGQAVKKSS